MPNISLIFNNPYRYPPSYYAELYKKYDLQGGHVIMLGKGNDKAAREALAAWVGQLPFFASVSIY